MIDSTIKSKTRL